MQAEKLARSTEEKVQLLASARPGLRTPEQERRFGEICAESLASSMPPMPVRRKRKKKKEEKDFRGVP